MDDQHKTIPVFKIAGLVGGKISGEQERLIGRAAAFDQADAQCVTFADKPALLKKVPDSKAGAIVVPETFEGESFATLIYCKHPRLDFAKIMELFNPRHLSISGISPAAFVGENLDSGDDIVIGAHAFIGNNVVLGSRVIIHPGVYIGDCAVIGDDTRIFPNVVVMDRCIIGKRVIIQAGTVIGSDGYGFVPGGGRHHKIPQTGIVEIKDDVEIGACNTIDRATFGSTLIEEGVKTDNLVHIAHNVTVGAHSLIVAQAGIAGSTTIGSHVTIAGQAGIGGHISIGKGAVVGPRAGVARSLEPGRVVSGVPEMDHRLWLRVQQVLPHLPEMKKQLKQMEKKLGLLEKALAAKNGTTTDKQ